MITHQVKASTQSLTAFRLPQNYTQDDLRAVARQQLDASNERMRRQIDQYGGVVVTQQATSIRLMLPNGEEHTFDFQEQRPMPSLYELIKAQIKHAFGLG